MPRTALGVLPCEPLALAAKADCDRDLAEALGVSMREVVRWRRGGVPVRHADQLAIRLWLHPLTVWGDSWHEAECTALAIQAEHDAELRRRRLARQAAYRERIRIAEWDEVMRSWRQWRDQQEREAS